MKRGCSEKVQPLLPINYFPSYNISGLKAENFEALQQINLE
jgi:hypothetical protein